MAQVDVNSLKKYGRYPRNRELIASTMELNENELIRDWSGEVLVVTGKEGKVVLNGDSLNLHTVRPATDEDLELVEVRNPVEDFFASDLWDN